MEKLTVGQILASVPGEFLGDESVRGTVVSNITHRVRDVRKNSVYVMPLKQKEPEEFLRNNLERMVAKGAALIISHTPPPEFKLFTKLFVHKR